MGEQHDRIEQFSPALTGLPLKILLTQAKEGGSKGAIALKFLILLNFG